MNINIQKNIHDNIQANNRKNILSSILSKLSLFVLLILLSNCFTSKNKIKLVDVNSPEVYQDAHIKGAINASYKNISNIANSWPKDSFIVVYCSNYMCTESARVAKKLISLGFNNVHVYKGGNQQWYQLSQKDSDKYQIVGPAKESYLHKELDQERLQEIENSSEEYKIIKAPELSKKLQEK